MSQNEGYLSEDELRDFINKLFDLKLTKDAYLKPTTDMVMLVYGKFLDDFMPQWAEINLSRDEDGNHEELDYMIVTLKCIRSLISKYDDIGITLQDILNPERKRTIIFLNCLVFIHLQIEQLSSVVAVHAGRLAEKAKERQQLDCQLKEVNQNIALLKAKVAEFGDEAELDKTIDKLKEEIEKYKVRGEKLRDQAQELKLANIEKRKDLEVKKFKKKIKAMLDLVCNENFKLKQERKDQELKFAEINAAADEKLLKAKEKTKQLQGILDKKMKQIKDDADEKKAAHDVQVSELRRKIVESETRHLEISNLKIQD